MPLATVVEVVRGWRDLDDDERADAEQLIEAAEAWIRDPARRPDIPEDDPIGKRVVIEVVRSAMSVSGEFYGHTSYTDTMGPWTQGGTLETPAGTLRFSESHAQLLGISISPLPRYHFGDCKPGGALL